MTINLEQLNCANRHVTNEMDALAEEHGIEGLTPVLVAMKFG